MDDHFGCMACHKRQLDRPLPVPLVSVSLRRIPRMNGGTLKCRPTGARPGRSSGPLSGSRKTGSYVRCNRDSQKSCEPPPTVKFSVTCQSESVNLSTRSKEANEKRGRAAPSDRTSLLQHVTLACSVAVPLTSWGKPLKIHRMLRVFRNGAGLGQKNAIFCGFAPRIGVTRREQLVKVPLAQQAAY